MQPKYINKTELRKMIDEIPYEEIMVLTYKKDKGISGKGKMLKKKKTKLLAEKADVILVIESIPVRRVDLKGRFNIFSKINRENIIKSILLP